MTEDTQVKQKRKVEWAEKEGEEGAEEEEEEEEGDEEAAETKKKRKKNLVRTLVSRGIWTSCRLL